MHKVSDEKTYDGAGTGTGDGGRADTPDRAVTSGFAMGYERKNNCFDTPHTPVCIRHALAIRNDNLFTAECLVNGMLTQPNEPP